MANLQPLPNPGNTETKLEKERKFQQETATKPYGFKLADELLAALLNAIEQKKWDHVIALREKGKALLKTAFKQNDPVLYAYTLQHLYRLCIQCFKNRELVAIQSLLELKSQEAQFVFELLQKQDLPAFAFWLVAVDDLEKFAEECEKDKNLILPFKRTIIQKLRDYNIKCFYPSLPEMHSLASLHEDNFRMRLRLQLDYFYITQSPREYARDIAQLMKMAFESPDSIMTLSFFIEVEAFSTKLDSAELLNSFHSPLFTWYITALSFHEFALSHNIEPKELSNFKSRVIQELEQIFQKPLLRTPEQIFKLLFEAIHNKKRVEAVILILEFVAQVSDEFQKGQQESPLKVGGLLIEFCQFVIKNQSELIVLFTKGFRLPQKLGFKNTLDLESLKAKENIPLIVCQSFNTQFFESIGRLVNVSEADSIEFARAVFESVAKANGAPSLFQGEEGLAQMAVENLSPNSALSTKILFKMQLAFDHKDLRLYAHLIQELVGLAQAALAAGKLEQLLVLAKMKLPAIPDLVEALDSRDIKNIAKVIIDYSLREFILEKDQYHNDLQDRYKTPIKFKKAVKAREEAYLNFQKDLYKHFGIDATPENLGKILNKGVKTQFDQQVFLPSVPKKEKGTEPDIKTTGEKLSLAVKTQNLEAVRKEAIILQGLLVKNLGNFKVRECQQILKLFMDAILEAQKINATGKFALLLDIISRRNYDKNKAQVLSRVKPVYFALFMKLLAEKNIKACYFVLVNALDWQAYLNYESEKLNKLLQFKNKVLEVLVPDLTIFNEQELTESLQIYKEGAFGNKTGLEYEQAMCRLDLYIKTLILKSQIPGKRARAAIDALGEFVLFHVRLLLEGYKNKILLNLNDFLNLSDHQHLVLAELLQSDLSEQEKLRFLCWIFINLSDQAHFYFDNKLSPSDLYQVKSAFYQAIAHLLGRKELLRSFDAVLKDLQELSTHPTPSSQIIRKLSLELRCLLMESFQAREVRDFANILSMLAKFMMTQINNPRFIAIFFKFNDNEKLQGFIEIAKTGNLGLTIRYILNLLKLYKWINQHLLENQLALEFFKDLLFRFECDLQPLLRQDPDVVLKGNLDKIAHFKYNDPQFNLMMVELDFQLRDAFLRENPEAFANLLSYIQRFMKHLHQFGNVAPLIHLFNLRAFNYDEPLCTEDFVIVREGEDRLFLEDLFQLLEANDRDAVLQLLFEFYIKKFSKTPGIGYLVKSEQFKEAVFKVLELNLVNLYSMDNMGQMDFEKHASTIAAQLQNLAANKVDLKLFEESFLRLAKSRPITKALVWPKDKDSEAYKTIFKKLNQIWIEHLVAHRFGIMDKSLEGSFSVTMATELQESCLVFSKSDLFTKWLAEMQAFLKGVSEEVARKTAENISKDIAEIFLTADLPKLSQKLVNKELVAIPVFLRSDNTGAFQWGHLTAAVFFQYKNTAYCIFADRGGIISEDNSGLIVYSIGNQENIYEVAYKLINSNESHLTKDQFKQAIQTLDLKEVYKILKKQQKSGNCGWLSSALMLEFSIIFGNCLQALGSLNPKLEAEATQQTAFQLAQKATRPLYKGHTRFDCEAILEKIF